MNGTSTGHRAVARWVGLAAGPILAVACYLLLPEQYTGPEGAPAEFSAAGRATLAVLAWMGVWWVTEAIDISATALLPIALLPLLQARTIGEATAPYADDLIFLFLGGFLLALSMQRWGLDRRIALVTLRLVGDRPMNIVAGIMLATAVMSMFVSNTATAAMMLPIALSVVALLRRGQAGEAAGLRDNFALCMMLGIAYAASIGGIATKIGTPPNGLLLGFIETTYGREIDFVSWLKIGLPLVVVFLPLTWLLLTRVLYPVPPRRIEGARELILGEYAKLGPARPGEWITFVVFTATACAWIFRPVLAATLLPGLSDAGIVVTAALLLFVIPVNRRAREFTLDWSTAKTLPWGILILFGGGLSLAAAVKDNGVAEFIGSGVAALGQVPPVILVLAVASMVIFMTELTSNTATTAALLPVLAGVADGIGADPFLLIVPAALAASCEFMMPVATPPNAIVFGSGYITIPQMCKAGLWINLTGIVLITLMLFWVMLPQL